MVCGRPGLLLGGVGGVGGVGAAEDEAPEGLGVGVVPPLAEEPLDPLNQLIGSNSEPPKVPCNQSLNPSQRPLDAWDCC